METSGEVAITRPSVKADLARRCGALRLFRLFFTGAIRFAPPSAANQHDDRALLRHRGSPTACPH